MEKKAVPAFTFEQMQKAQDDLAEATADRLCPMLLSLFEPGKPLEVGAVEDWMLLNVIRLSRVSAVMDDCLKFGWAVKKPEGYFITERGSQKADEV
jgi:hypothetical protein